MRPPWHCPALCHHTRTSLSQQAVLQQLLCTRGHLDTALPCVITHAQVLESPSSTQVLSLFYNAMPCRAVTSRCCSFCCACHAAPAFPAFQQQQLDTGLPGYPACETPAACIRRPSSLPKDCTSAACFSRPISLPRECAASSLPGSLCAP